MIKFCRKKEVVILPKTLTKKERHNLLKDMLKENPFLKDDQLAERFSVSIATIRFDRAELGILEYRERIKKVAKDGYEGIKSILPEMLDLNPMHDAISMLQTDMTMTFEGTDIIKGQVIFSFAENTALKVIDSKAALIKVANVKYTKEVRAGEKLLAKSEVKRIKDDEYIVWVKIKSNMTEVFRGKFMLMAISDEK